jgi:8-oxo-dGTP pyrophosphatase MutT (NUDIX family)
MEAKILSAGIIIVRREADKWLYLLLRAYNHWDFPKGLVEPGETPLRAAIRETEEETTVTDLHFKWGHGYRETGPGRRGKVARYYLAMSGTAQVTLPVSEELGHPEHDEFRWLTYAQARALLKPHLAEILAWAHANVEG